MPNNERTNVCPFVIGYWVFVILSSFGLRHSSFWSGRPQRLEEGDQLGLLGVAEAFVAAGGPGALGAVGANRLLKRRGAAVVQVRGRVGHAPQRRRPPLGGQRAAVGVARLRRRQALGRSVVGDGGAQVGRHAVQQQVAVDALDVADVGGVAV